MCQSILRAALVEILNFHDILKGLLKYIKSSTSPSQKINQRYNFDLNKFNLNKINLKQAGVGRSMRATSLPWLRRDPRFYFRQRASATTPRLSWNCLIIPASLLVVLQSLYQFICYFDSLCAWNSLLPTSR